MKSDKECCWTIITELNWLKSVSQAKNKINRDPWTPDEKVQFFEGYIASFQLGSSSQFDKDEQDKLLQQATKYLAKCRQDLVE